ncbi:hypothetical protein E4T47_01347 [Aureobasidium subglaciale]|nr:hypothetical protein E4T47_01347 [Aureobasidium subglaciale]
MSHLPYAWADSYGGMYPSLEQCLGVDACGNEARDPTVFRQQQPFRSAENVSATPKPSFHHHAVDHMARQQPPGPLLSSSASASEGPLCAPAPAMAASDQAACFLSPCDKPDCDEATICYDYSLPHYADLHCSQDALSCTEAFDCAETNCNAAEWLCTDLNCHEPGCDQEHARECTPACAAAATVSCSDPTCSEDHLYCCLSDVCPRPHPPGTECPQPCHDQHIPSTVCHPGPAVNCTQPYGYKIPSTIATASQDTMSTSTISTPTTDSIPTPDNFQSLIEAASLMPHLGYSFPTTNAYPPRKRMRLDESNSFHDFNAPYYAPNDYWQQDLSQSFGSSQFPSASQPITASASPAIKTKVRQDKASRDLDDIAMCRWNDEHTGPCNRVFATIEDLHNHVKDHTCTLIPSKTPNRTFICRWDGCEKDAPFVHEDDKTAIPCPHPGCEYRDSRAQRLERHCRDTGHGLVLLSDAHKWNMAIISPSIKAHVNRKQLKSSYRIPRSVKKAIEKNVKKIIKKHERKLREVEARKVAIDIEARTFQARGYLDAFDHVIRTFDMTDDLAMALDALLTRCNRNTESAIGRQKAGLLGKKAFAKKVLEGGYVTEEIKQEMMAWKGQDKDAEEESVSESDE